MSRFLKWVTDRLVLRPTTNPLGANDQTRFVFRVEGGEVEAWRQVWGDPEETRAQPILVIKFPGNAGRAERATVHPFDVWKQSAGEVWTLNHRGYGGSTGPASLQNFSDTVDALWLEIDQLLPRYRVLVYGNSLGSLSALYMAMRYPVHGVYLRNGFCLRRLIRMRKKYNSWNLGMAGFLAQQVPRELDSIANAKRCTAPCLFVRSEKDTMIPAVYQMDLINRYRGSIQEFLNIGADHHDPIDGRQWEAYQNSLHGFYDSLMQYRPGE